LLLLKLLLIGCAFQRDASLVVKADSGFHEAVEAAGRVALEAAADSASVSMRLTGIAAPSVRRRRVPAAETLVRLMVRLQPIASGSGDTLRTWRPTCRPTRVRAFFWVTGSNRACHRD
jgi:hypothetical protein